MRRRALLSTVAGGLAALSGCASAGNAGDAGDTPSSSPTPTESATPGTDSGTTARATPADATPTDGMPTDRTPVHQTPAISADVTVDSLELQYGVVMPASPDSIGVEHVETPYVLAAVNVDGELPPSEFAFRVGDRSFEPTAVERLYRTSWGGEQYYEASGRGLLLFELPVGASGDARLTWPGGERSLDPAAGARLDRGQPQFSASLALPETHEGTEAPTVEIEVTNESDTPARFLGALNRTGPLVAYTPVARVSELVDAGATATLAVDDRWTGTPAGESVGDGEPDVTYRLHYGEASASAGIRIVGSSVTATDASR